MLHITITERYFVNDMNTIVNNCEVVTEESSVNVVVSSVTTSSSIDVSQQEDSVVVKTKRNIFKKILQPWKWKSKKKSSKLRETSKILEGKISVRISHKDPVSKDVSQDACQGAVSPSPYPELLEIESGIDLSTFDILDISSEKDLCDVGQPMISSTLDKSLLGVEDSTLVCFKEDAAGDLIPCQHIKLNTEKEHSLNNDSHGSMTSILESTNNNSEYLEELWKSPLKIGKMTGEREGIRNTLEKKLSVRPSIEELATRGMLPSNTESERAETKKNISVKLARRLSIRPTETELMNRNILRQHTVEETQTNMKEKRDLLQRRLSFRPSVEELRKRKILQFNDYIEVTEADNYDRRTDKPWTRLSSVDKADIRKELNQFKSLEMLVHEESRHRTRYHRP